MSAALDELSGSQTQTYNLEAQKPVLQLVEEDRNFRRVNLAEEVEDCLGLDETDERVKFVMDLVSNPTAMSVSFLEDIAVSKEQELLELSVLISPKILREGLETAALEDADLDRVRNVLAMLMSHPNEDIQELAQESFMMDAPRLIERDTVSYQWLGWLGIKKPTLITRSYSSDIAIKSKALLA